VTRLLRVALLALVAVVLVATPAAAHAVLVASDPADGAVLEEAPDTLTLTFDERVATHPTGSDVHDPSGLPLPVTESASGRTLSIALPPDLADGSYVVYWRVISAGDDHPIAGVLTFSVGSATTVPDLPDLEQEPPSSTALVQALLSGAALLGLLVAGGLLVLARWLLPTATPGRWWDGSALLAVVAHAALVPVAAAYQRQEPLTAWPAWSWSLVDQRVVVLGLVTVGLAGARLLWVRRPGLAVVCAAVAVAAPAWVGHSRSATPELLVGVADATHLWAASVWLGGVVGLWAWRDRVDAEVLRRFGHWAAACLVVLSLEGALLAWRILGSWSGFVDLAYGRLLLAKLCLVLVVVALGLVLRSRRDDRSEVAALLGAEVLVLSAVVGVVGFLVDEPPEPLAASRVVTAPSSSGEVSVAGRTVTVTLDPGTRGANRLLVDVTDAEGRPGRGPAPVVTLSHPSYDLGEIPQTRVGPGQWDTLVLVPIHGDWTVTVTLDGESAELVLRVAAGA